MMNLDEMLTRIAEFSDDDINVPIEALSKREKQLHPDWECMYLAFPLEHPDECRGIMEMAWKKLKIIMEKGSDA